MIHNKTSSRRHKMKKKIAYLVGISALSLTLMNGLVAFADRLENPFSSADSSAATQAPASSEPSASPTATATSTVSPPASTEPSASNAPSASPSASPEATNPPIAIWDDAPGVMDNDFAALN